MAKDVLFEIGLEELPARFIDDAEKQLNVKTEAWLRELRISYNSITTFSTPRRLTVLIEGMAEEQTTIEEEAKGPAEKIAKDTDGNWSKAAVGFTKGQGKTVEDIYTKDLKGITYIFVRKYIDGKPTFDLLPQFKTIIESIQFGKNMRWGEETLRYARPIRWLVALYGEKVIPIKIAGVGTSNLTFGHRFLGSEFNLSKPKDYQRKLYENFVIVDPGAREHLIIKGIKDIEEKNSYLIPIDKDLLDEVRNLVEYPTVFIGSFEQQFLKLPPEILITSMKEHQRYFPVKSREGELLPYFIGVRNGDNYEINTVIRGNEKVLHARLSDAEFFYEEDQKHSIDHYNGKLERVVFQEKLGTISDKVKRIGHITNQVTKLLNLDAATSSLAARTAAICKFDLVTNMVNEFTELQGVIGEKYARVFGEDEAVANGIREHYLPKQANGVLPVSTVGSVVSIADKLDTIVGCISVGLTPTGSQDPYGLRRQAAGILRIMNNEKWNVTMEDLLEITQELYRTLRIDQIDHKQIKKELTDFFKLRATYLLKEMSIEQDIIQAVFHKEIGRVDYAMSKAATLSEIRNDSSFKSVQEALVRILNLSNNTQQTNVNPDLLETDSEVFLYKRYLTVTEEYKTAKKELKSAMALTNIGELSEPIHDFFEHNMVMAESEQIRNNRIALVNSIAMLILDYADLRKIEWKQHF
ncbi:glycine--tRNA ligase subunit beta [Virgibacillus sp. C22-A2]|uniref:Glycine--tRNA ligase beta subunit n=1 Tax=Virgibacillus tibetensis TaxID=3042313 RepID=A0ABU6KA58_9BACI|nr:glycine--tRNA ligase subunit beta [Virgibacillus sp. C22-A2]